MKLQHLHREDVCRHLQEMLLNQSSLVMRIKNILGTSRKLVSVLSNE